MASHSEFGHFYQLQNPSMLEDHHFMDAMAGTSTALTPSQTSPSSPGDSSPFSSTLNPEGRVSKPARKRSRASRRTPTTLVNTDPSNFRAMVQQLTGGPAAAYTVAEPRYQMFGEGNISFGFGTNPQRSNNPSTEDVQQQQQQRQAYQQQQLQFNRNMFSAMNRNHDGSLS